MILNRNALTDDGMFIAGGSFGGTGMALTLL